MSTLVEDNEMCEIIIGNPESDHVSIVKFKAMYPSATNISDKNWLACEINISAGAFSGITQASLRSDEFQIFLKALQPIYDTLKGTAQYRSIEKWIELDVSGDGRGHIAINGHVIDNHCNGNKLFFCIMSDQTYLRNTINSIERLLEKFPV